MKRRLSFFEKGSWVGGGGVDDGQAATCGKVLPLLPDRKDVVDVAMVEIEDRIKASNVVIADIAIGSFNGVCMIHSPLVKTTKGKMDRIMRTFQRKDGRVNQGITFPSVFSPLGLRSRVRKDGEVGCVKTCIEFGTNGIGVWDSDVRVRRILRDLDGA